MREGAEYFLNPAGPSQRRYEALRAYFTEDMPASEVADKFGYSTASVHQMATLLRKGRLALFADPRPGPKGPRKATGHLRARVLALRAAGHSVLRLVRRPPAAAGEVQWDPRIPGGGLAPAALAGLDAVVNLAGAGLADRRWTAAYKEEIRSSRLRATTALVAALTALDKPPAVLLSGSAIGWYGDTGGREVDETAPHGTGFLPELVRDWEAAAAPAADAGIRVVTLRTGLVLSARGGMLGRLLLPFRLGLGARLGPGTQVMSWLALADYLAIAAFLLANPGLSGPVNLTSPAPVSNAEFTAALASALHRPAVLTVPTPVLTAVLGEVSSDLLSSARVLPKKLLAAGYQYRYPDVRGALQAVVAGA